MFHHLYILVTETASEEPMETEAAVATPVVSEPSDSEAIADTTELKPTDVVAAAPAESPAAEAPAAATEPEKTD